MKKLFLLFLSLSSWGCRYSSGPASDTRIPVIDGTPVPYLKITTQKTIENEPKTDATLSIRYQDSVVFQQNVGIEVRGAISQMYPKKSYGFELRNEQNNSIAKGILGLPADDDWILYGSFNDPSLIRNRLAYRVSNHIGRYAARSQWVEVEINGEYLGAYLLMEKLKRDKNRIDIKGLNANDTNITGGYILKLDKAVGNDNDQYDYDEGNSFPSAYRASGRLSKDANEHFLYHYPKPKDITPQQKAYIQHYIYDFETALASQSFADSTLGYAKYIDTDSFIDYFILTELFQNFDGYRISTFLQKDQNQKLQMGPIWDFDLTMGMPSFCSNIPKENIWVYRYNDYCGSDTWLVPFWWKKLLQDPSFVAQLKNRWRELRQEKITEKSLMQMIDNETVFLKNTHLLQRNTNCWGTTKQAGAYDREIDQMKHWLKARLQWIDVEIQKIEKK